MAQTHLSFLGAFLEILLSVLLLKCIHNYLYFSGHNLYNFSVTNAFLTVCFYFYFNIKVPFDEWSRRKNSAAARAPLAEEALPKPPKKEALPLKRYFSPKRLRLSKKSKSRNPNQRWNVRKKSTSLERTLFQNPHRFPKKKRKAFQTPKKKRLASDTQFTFKASRQPRFARETTPKVLKAPGKRRAVRMGYAKLLFALSMNTNHVLFQYYINFDSEIQPFTQEESNLFIPRLNHFLRKQIQPKKPSIYLTNPIFFYLQLILFGIMFWRLNFSDLRPIPAHLFFYFKASVVTYLCRMLVYLIGKGCH